MRSRSRSCKEIYPAKKIWAGQKTRPYKNSELRQAGATF
jgi:hypothetical protein